MKEYLYKEVQEYILEKILNLEYKQGSKIPSERKIAEELNLSRMTVKNAINKLTEDRILFRIHGKGTFVTATKDSKGKMIVSNFTPDSFNKNVSVLGKFSNSIVISFRVIYDKTELQNLFDKNKDFYELCRVRMVDSKPVSVEYTYFPFRKFIDAIRYNFEELSLYEYMEHKGKKPVFFKKETEVVKEEKINKILGIDEKEPLFKTTYIGKTEEGVIVEYTNSYIKLTEVEFKYVRNISGL